VTPNFPHQNHGTVVWDSSNSFWCVLRGLSPSMAGHFRPLQLNQRRDNAGPLTLHLRQVSLQDSVWTIPISLAATKGIPCLVSFPPPTKMLPFGGFPLRKGAFLGSPIQESSVLRLRAPTRGGIAACRALLQLSSRAILQTAWHVRALVVSV
jgi:hypothetical protein